MSALLTSDTAKITAHGEQRIERLNRELVDMRNLYLEQYRRANEYLHQRNLLEDEIITLKRANYVLQQNCERKNFLENENATLKHVNSALQQNCERQARDINEIINAYQSSRSWKITTPLRGLGTLLRRLFVRKKLVG